MTEEKQTLIQRIGWKFYMWKLEFFCRHLERKHKAARRKYCRKGYHKLTKCSYSVKEHKKRTIKIDYLKCLHCNYHFFTSVKQKEMYMKLEGKAKDSFSAFLKSISSAKQKHS